MLETYPQIFSFLGMIVFLLTVCMHLVKKNMKLINLYLLQSLSLSLILFMMAFEEFEGSLFVAAFLTFAIKTVIAPIFFYRLIKRHGVAFVVSTYLNTPLTLLALLALTAFAHSHIFTFLIPLSPREGASYIPFILSNIFNSFFLIINRKGALSQIVGILSLENGIVFLVSFIGLKQSLALELGITFDIAVWIIIAVIFLSMVQKQFGSLDSTKMQQLKEE